MVLLVPEAVSQQGMLDHLYRSRYSEGLLALRVGGGINRYQGDFEPVDDARLLSMSAMYSIRPFLSAGIRVDYGKASYRRSAEQVDAELYDFQFDDTDVERFTEFSAFQLALQVTPIQWSVFDLYGFIGAGVAVYNAQDHSSDAAKVRPKADLPGAIVVPFGVGLDLHLTQSIALSGELHYKMMFAGDFDAYDDKLLTIDYIKSGGRRPYQSEQSYDNMISFSAGIRIFLFQNDDYDGDLINNWSEEALGSDPYNIDSDADGLSDYEEAFHYKSNPLVFDSDKDGLSDHEEITVFRTASMARDTDGDALLDFDEIYRHGTNPLLADTDSDGLSDREELDLGTNPAHIDSDLDGLTDTDEVRIFRTNPLKADSEEDGVFDYNEVTTYGTNPLAEDTDGEGLSDYEEIAFHRTNPLLVDTDKDGLRDDHEIVTTRTNPLDRDTDGDGIWDGVDQCPLVPENYNGISDTDGCPDGIGFPAPPIASRTDRGKGTGPDTGEGGDRGEGTGPDTGEGGDRGRGTGPGTDEGGDRGEGTGPDTGEGGVWSKDKRTIFGPSPRSLLSRYFDYDPRYVKHIVPYQSVDSSSRKLVRYDYSDFAFTHTLPEFTVDGLELGKTFMLGNIHFEFDRDVLNVEYLDELLEKAQIFTTYPELTVEIRGHTDNEGTDEYNENLSTRRALAVKNFFVKHGVSPKRLLAKGFGKTRPLTDNDTDMGKSLNRRVEMHVLKLGKKETIR